MGECETIQALKGHVENHTGLEVVASACLRIIEDIRLCGLSDHAIGYLHYLVDDIFKDGHIELFDHLSTGATDCEICKAMADRIAINRAGAA